jgi:hypothetical protein
VRTLYLGKACCSSLLVCHRVYLGPLSASLRPLAEHPIILLLGIDSAESQTLMLVPHGHKHVTEVCRGLQKYPSSQQQKTSPHAFCVILRGRFADASSQSLDVGRFLASVIVLSGLPRQISGTTELNMHTIHADVEPSSTSGCLSLAAEPAMSQLTTATGPRCPLRCRRLMHVFFQLLCPASSVRDPLELVLYNPRSY